MLKGQLCFPWAEPGQLVMDMSWLPLQHPAQGLAQSRHSANINQLSDYSIVTILVTGHFHSHFAGAHCTTNTSRLKFDKSSRTVYLLHSCLMLEYCFRNINYVELQQSTIPMDIFFLARNFWRLEFIKLFLFSPFQCWLKWFEGGTWFSSKNIVLWVTCQNSCHNPHPTLVKIYNPFVFCDYPRFFVYKVKHSFKEKKKTKNKQTIKGHFPL